MNRTSLNILKEPVSISVCLDKNKGRAIFSDIPEQLLQPLVQQFGMRTVLSAIVPGEIERNFYLELDEADRAEPRYRALLASGEFERRVRELEGEVPETVPYFMTAINRTDEAVFGRTGAIYFVCRKGCHFCQYKNFAEKTLTVEGLAERMLALEDAGADNIHWVSPTAYTKFLVKALFLAAKRGLKIPIIHKSEGEDSLKDLKLLDGLVDVYLPDIKFINPAFAPNIGLPATYPERMKACIREMYRQVGPLKRRKEIPASGIPLEAGGMMIRHLIMPGGVKEARGIFEFLLTIYEAIPLHMMVNYQPYHEAGSHPVIGRHVTVGEVEQVIAAANQVGMRAAFVG
jgi:putative pyruvate formate lyase activating enzyme